MTLTTLRTARAVSQAFKNNKGWKMTPVIEAEIGRWMRNVVRREIHCPELLHALPATEGAQGDAKIKRTRAEDIPGMIKMRDEGATALDVARYYGISDARVRTLLAKQGIRFPMGRSRARVDVDRAVELRRQGLSFDRIAREINATRDVVTRRLREVGMK